MKRHIAMVWVLAFFALLAYLSFLAAHLPEHLAVHFDINGKPNGYQAKMEFITTFLWFILMLNGVFAAIFFFLDKVPVALVNIPWKKYWTASPERWTEALHRLRIVLGLLGIFVNVSFLVTEQVIYEANNPGMGTLLPFHSGIGTIFVMTAILVGLVFWISKPPQNVDGGR